MIPGSRRKMPKGYWVGKGPADFGFSYPDDCTPKTAGCVVCSRCGYKVPNISSLSCLRLMRDHKGQHSLADAIKDFP